MYAENSSGTTPMHKKSQVGEGLVVRRPRLARFRDDTGTLSHLPTLKIGTAHQRQRKRVSRSRAHMQQATAWSTAQWVGHTSYIKQGLHVTALLVDHLYGLLCFVWVLLQSLMSMYWVIGVRRWLKLCVFFLICTGHLLDARTQAPVRGFCFGCFVLEHLCGANK